MAKVTITGFDKIEQNIKQKIEVSSPESIYKIMPPEFIRLHTKEKFESLEHFFSAYLDEKDLTFSKEMLTTDEFNQFMKANSCHDSWKEMYQIALRKYIVEKLSV